MALITYGLTVNDIDRSIHFLDTTLRVEWKLGERGSASFSWRSNIPAGLGTAVEVPDLLPDLGQQIALFANGVRFYTGDVQSIRVMELGPRFTGGARILGAVKAEISLASLESRLQKRVVPAAAYITDETGIVPWTAGGLITDAITNYASGSGVVLSGDLGSFIEDGADVGALVAGQDQPRYVWDMVKEAAERSGMVAYVDAENYLHLESRTALQSVFSISMSGTNFRDFQVFRQYHDKANRVHHRIGWEAFEPAEFSVEGDGTTTEFQLSGFDIDNNIVAGRPVRIEQMLILGVANNEETPVTWGTRADENNPDFTWGTGSARILSNEDGAVLQVGEVLNVRYRPLGGDVLLTEDTADQAARGAIEGDTSGLYERISENLDTKTVEDGTIESDRMLEENTDPKYEITFVTDNHIEPAALNIRPGMLVPISMAPFGVPTADYLIDSVSITDNRGMTLDVSIHCIDQGVENPKWTERAKTPGGTQRGSTSGSSRGGKTQGPTTGGQHSTAFEEKSLAFGSCVAASGEDITFWANVLTSGTPYHANVNSKEGSTGTVDLMFSADGDTFSSLTAGVGFAVEGTTPKEYTNEFDGTQVTAPGVIRADVISGSIEWGVITARWKRLSPGQGDMDGDDAGNPLPPIF